MKKAIKMIAGACAAAVVCAGGLLYYNLSRQNVRHTSATFVMDAVADQKVYGPNGENRGGGTGVSRDGEPAFCI